jgi:uncharacterized protein
MPLEFEFDPLKSALNGLKHGITLADAVRFRNCPRRRYIRGRITSGEHRHAIICEYESEVWIAVFTARQGRIRIISARRASRAERRTLG